MAVTTPKPKHVIRGRFRNTLKAVITMVDRLADLDEKRPDLEILNEVTKTYVDALPPALQNQLDRKTS